MWSHGAFDSTKVCHRALTQACSVIRWLLWVALIPWLGPMAPIKS